MIEIIIPAYKPNDELIKLVDLFAKLDEVRLLIVDDGSGEEFKHVFNEVKIRDYCTILTHEVNKGKGCALKTAIAYILESVPECDVAVTADADGQHTFDDIMMVANIAKENPDALVLGGRRFDENVPFKSKFGNALTRRVFSLASGVKVYDTQTGLRAFSRKLMNSFVNVDGDRYEYEMNMLLSAAQSGVPIIEKTIKTIYLDQKNSSSHFHAFRDSIKIYFCILKFACSSFICFIIDYIMFMLFSSLTAYMGVGTSLIVSEIAARAVSSVANFAINRKVVFKSKENVAFSFLKYILLVISVLACDYALMYIATQLLFVPNVIAKPLVALILFFVNLIVQGRVVFRKRDTKKNN
ncbi:MAG: bifunctional glycosyltransferase family 2/GtrA family protein [Clostridia bacterium]